MFTITCAGCGRTPAQGEGGWRHFGQRWLCHGCPMMHRLVALVRAERA